MDKSFVSAITCCGAKDFFVGKVDVDLNVDDAIGERDW